MLLDPVGANQNDPLGRRTRKASNRDHEVAATVVQWLGSNVGMDFLIQSIRRSPEALRFIREGLRKELRQAKEEEDL